MATGVRKAHGKPNGAPLRLAVPWKYGFKSVKSIVSFEFTAERPLTFWEEANGSEYGFWANVNLTCHIVGGAKQPSKTSTPASDTTHKFITDTVIGLLTFMLGSTQRNAYSPNQFVCQSMPNTNVIQS